MDAEDSSSCITVEQDIPYERQSRCAARHASYKEIQSSSHHLASSSVGTKSPISGDANIMIYALLTSPSNVSPVIERNLRAAKATAVRPRTKMVAKPASELFGTITVKLAFRLQEDSGFCNATVKRNLTAEELLLSYTVSPKRKLLVKTRVKAGGDLEEDGQSEQKPSKEEVKQEVLEQAMDEIAVLGEQWLGFDVEEMEEGLWAELFGEEDDGLWRRLFLEGGMATPIATISGSDHKENTGGTGEKKKKDAKVKPVLLRLRREAWHRTIRSLAQQYAGDDTLKLTLCQSGKLESLYTSADKMK